MNPDILTVSGFFYTVIRVDLGQQEGKFYFPRLRCNAFFLLFSTEEPTAGMIVRMHDPFRSTGVPSADRGRGACPDAGNVQTALLPYSLELRFKAHGSRCCSPLPLTGGIWAAPSYLFILQLPFG